MKSKTTFSEKIVLTILLLFLGSFILSVLDYILLNRYIYEKKPGFKSEARISYDSFLSEMMGVDCKEMRKSGDLGEIPIFQHFKCESTDYVWVQRASALSLTVYKDQPYWLIGMHSDQ